MVSNRPRNVAFLSTFPPRECGLATFTQDLVNELDKIQIIHNPRIIAVGNENKQYDSRVMMVLQQHKKESYIETAKKLNTTDTELLVIEHEYGIFGGDCGEYLLEFVNHLKIPFITTLHTVLPSPTDKQREILKTLGQKSEKIVTMAKNTVAVLEKVYEIPLGKIEVIHHGVPFREMKSREELKEKHGLKDRKVISTFGLISPGKGIEYGIEAIAEVVRKHKDIVYLILGQTHPCIRKESGESYRDKLEVMVDSLGIKENVWFVNKYLSKDEIIHYLQISDIYMTPYLGKDQAVSGTLAYAVGYGRVVVSTPYSYAKEMITEDRGLLAEFRDAHSLAKCIQYVLDHPGEKQKMEQEALKVGRTMMWGNIAVKYAELFVNVLEQCRKGEALVI